MNVFLVAYESPFFETAPIKRIICYIKGLQSSHVDCVWLMKKQDQAHVIPYEGIYNGIPYKMVGGACSVSPRWKRLLFCLYSEVCAIIFFIKNLKKSDVVFLYTCGVFWSLILIKIAHFKHAKVVSDMCELPSGTGVETLSKQRSRRRYERFILSALDGVIPISDTLSDYSLQFIKNGCWIQKVPILVDYGRYRLEDKSAEAEIPYIFHSGTLTEQKDGILGMIEAFGIASKKLGRPIRFICTGVKERSLHAKEIDQLVQRYNLQNSLIFTGYLTDDQLKDTLQRASITIINKAENQQNKYCFSTKLGEYMAAGKAIIITKVGEAMNWLEDGKDALIVPPQDNAALSDAIVKLFQEDSLRKKLGINAREKCRNSFDYHIWGKVMADAFSKNRTI